MMSDQQPKQKSAVAPKSKAMGVRGHRIRDLAKTEERRREILLGAARAFARSGYDATNMDQIARECGLAKGHIYHYFLSKEDIFSEIRTDAISRAIDQLSAIARGSNGDPELTLQKAISALIAWVFEQAGRYEPVLARSGVAKPGQSKTHTDLVAALRADVRKHPAPRNRQGNFRPERSEAHDICDPARRQYRRRMVSRGRQMETQVDS